MKYYSVGYGGDNLARLSALGVSNIRSVQCAKCRHVPHGGDAVAIDLRQDPGGDDKLGALADAPLGLIQREFALKIGAAPFLALGEVSVEGVRLDEWATFRGLEPIYIRGDVTSTYWVCETCGYKVYFPFGDNRYLVKESVRPNRIYTSQLLTLVFPECLFRKEWFDSADIEVEEIRVIDAPLDGRGIAI